MPEEATPRTAKNYQRRHCAYRCMELVFSCSNTWDIILRKYRKMSGQPGVASVSIFFDLVHYSFQMPETAQSPARSNLIYQWTREFFDALSARRLPNFLHKKTCNAAAIRSC